MPADKSQTRAFALLGFVMLLWAGNSIVARAVRLEVPPFSLAFGRWLLAFSIILPFALGALRRDWSALRQGWVMVLVLGLLGIGAFNALLYTGLQHSTATNALLLQSLVPAMVAGLDRALFGVRAGPMQLLGMAASIIGVAIIVFEGDPAAAARLDLTGADLLLLGSALVWSVYTVLLRLKPPVAATSFVAATFFVGVVTMAPLALWEWTHGAQVQWSGRVAGAYLYVGILPSLVAYLIYNPASQVVGPARAGQTITLMPLFGAFLSAALLGEALHAYHFTGMAFIVAGIVLGAMSLRGEKVSAELSQSAAGAGGKAPLEG